MSKVIKSSRIIGEYKLNNLEVEIDEDNSSQNNTPPSPATAGDIKEGENEKVTAARKQADEIIARAEKKAAEIESEARQQAEKELENVRKQGYKEGFEQGEKEGYEEGISEGIKELKMKAETLKKVVEKVRAKFEKEKQKLPGKIIDLSTMIATRIINVELDIKPDFINNIIKDMLSDISDNHQKIKIRVIPELIEYIETAEIESLLGDQAVEFVGDNSLEKGDCIVKTDFGGKDGSRAHKLEKLEKELYKGLG